MIRIKITFAFVLISFTGRVSTQSWTPHDLTTPAMMPGERLLQHTQCSCASKYASNSPYKGCSKCWDGCFKARQANSKTFYCRPCSSNCDSCTNPKVCKKCAFTYYLTKNAHSCEKCLVSRCRSCVSPGTTCTECIGSFYPASGGTSCAPCLPHCAVCSSKNTCKDCESMYHWDLSKGACVKITTSDLFLDVLYVIGLVIVCLICFCIFYICARMQPRGPDTPPRRRTEDALEVDTYAKAGDDNFGTGGFGGPHEEDEVLGDGGLVASSGGDDSGPKATHEEDEVLGDGGLVASSGVMILVRRGRGRREVEWMTRIILVRRGRGRRRRRRRRRRKVEWTTLWATRIKLVPMKIFLVLGRVGKGKEAVGTLLWVMRS